MLDIYKHLRILLRILLETNKQTKEVKKKYTDTWKGYLMRQQQNDANLQDKNFSTGVLNAVLLGSDSMSEM